MTELQIKTQKKLMKMGKGKVDPKPIEAPSPVRKVVSDCLTVELKTHVFQIQFRNLTRTVYLYLWEFYSKLWELIRIIWILKAFSENQDHLMTKRKLSSKLESWQKDSSSIMLKIWEVMPLLELSRNFSQNCRLPSSLMHSTTNCCLLWVKLVSSLRRRSPSSSTFWLSCQPWTEKFYFTWWPSSRKRWPSGAIRTKWMSTTPVSASFLASFEARARHWLTWWTAGSLWAFWMCTSRDTRRWCRCRRGAAAVVRARRPRSQWQILSIFEFQWPEFIQFFIFFWSYQFNTHILLSINKISNIFDNKKSTTVYFISVSSSVIFF